MSALRDTRFSGARRIGHSRGMSTQADVEAQTGTVIVPAVEEHAAITTVLASHGATAHDARLQADMLLEGDLRGQHSHGIRRLPVLAKRLDRGVSTSGEEPIASWSGASRVHLDGRRGLGPAVAHRALDLILPRAAETGVAVASIANAGHAGMLAPYVERIAGEGCVGIALTVSEALVAPWGGTRAMVGTNPIGIGVPTGGDPLILDMSTASASAGKILDYAARGESIPLGWAVDERGEPTSDAAAAAKGAISPFGGAKGFALGVAFEALVGVLAGSAFGRDVSGTLDTELPPNKGDLFIALPVDGGSAAFRGVADYLAQLRLEGGEGREVRVPGDRARAIRAERLEHGVPLDRRLWAEIEALRDAGPPVPR